MSTDDVRKKAAQNCKLYRKWNHTDVGYPYKKALHENKPPGTSCPCGRCGGEFIDHSHMVQDRYMNGPYKLLQAYLEAKEPAVKGVDPANSAFSRQVGGNHYAGMKIQPTEFILANELGFAEGNVVKYVCRYKLKNGLEDLKKARHYIDMLIEQKENET